MEPFQKTCILDSNYKGFFILQITLLLRHTFAHGFFCIMENVEYQSKIVSAQQTFTDN